MCSAEVERSRGTTKSLEERIKLLSVQYCFSLKGLSQGCTLFQCHESQKDCVRETFTLTWGLYVCSPKGVIETIPLMSSFGIHLLSQNFLFHQPCGFSAKMPSLKLL